MNSQRTKTSLSAGARQNEDFFWIFTYSGAGLLVIDPEGHDVVLELDADDIQLGRAVMIALERSRTLSPDEMRRLITQPKADDEYEKRVETIRIKNGYKSESVMFGNMKNCSIKLAGKVISILPSRHGRLKQWYPLSDEVVVVAADSAPRDIGAALRSAFSLCRERWE